MKALWYVVAREREINYSHLAVTTNLEVTNGPEAKTKGLGERDIDYPYLAVTANLG